MSAPALQTDSIALTIDPEFQRLIPALRREELELLEASLLREGCRDPLAAWNGILVDGHNRYAICVQHGLPFDVAELDFTSRAAAEDWIITSQLGRRNLTAEQFRYFIGAHYNREKRAVGANQHGRRLPQLEGASPVPEMQVSDPPGETAQRIAAQHGVHRHTVERAGQWAQRVDRTPGAREALMQGKAVKPVIRKAQTEEDRVELEAAQAEIDEDRRASIVAVCDLRVCSCEALFASGIRPDVVLTDPPYPEDFLPVYTELARACKDVPVVAVMAGQTYLPEVMRRLCEYLSYRWTLAYLTPGGQAVQQWQTKVNTAWKPVLLFGAALDWLGDVAASKVNGNDKRFHDWGQSESGMADLVERLSKPGQLICDPFLGGGTTAVVALARSRRFVGCDIDVECINKTRMRVEAWQA